VPTEKPQDQPQIESPPSPEPLHGLEAHATHGRDARATVLRDAGVEILELPADGTHLHDTTGTIDLPALLDELGRRRMTHLLVEGGPAVLHSFLHAGLADEVRIYTSPQTLRDKFPQESLANLPRMDMEKFPPPDMELEHCHELGKDTLRCYAHVSSPGRGTLGSPG